MTGPDKNYYRAFRSIFGVTPDNIELYKLALVHRSASVRLENGESINNERLEFLGDAVLESVVSDYLFIEYPHGDEGFLTKMRAKIVSRQSLNDLAEHIGLDSLVVFHSSGGTIQKHLLGNAFEAVVGALYLDKGYDTVNRIIINDLLPRFVDVSNMSSTENDFKSRLIEWCQKSKRTIIFHTEADGTATENHPLFVSHITIDDMSFGKGSGQTKKEAEQRASAAAWQLLGDEIGDYILDRYDLLSQDEHAER